MGRENGAGALRRSTTWELADTILNGMKQGAASNFAFIEPMNALRVGELPVGDWIYEMKFDGYRALAFKMGSEVRLLSRNRTLFNENYPVLVEALKSLKRKVSLLTAKSLLRSRKFFPPPETRRSQFFYERQRGVTDARNRLVRKIR